MNSSTQKENTRTLLSLLGEQLGEQLGERLCEPTPIQAETVLGKRRYFFDWGVQTICYSGSDRDRLGLR